MSRRPMRFARQVLALQIGLIVLVTGIGFAIAAALLDRGLVEQYGQRALGVARSVAADDELARGVTDPALHPLVAAKAERVRAATGALFIVVTDSRGVRLSHPVPEKIGDPVSTDPSAALTGREAVDVQRGTLGWSARGKVPLRTADGTVVGQVSVGFDAHEIDTAFLRLLGTSAGLAAGALLLGVAGAALLTRLLKRRTLGLEPHELASWCGSAKRCSTGSAKECSPSTPTNGSRCATRRPNGCWAAPSNRAPRSANWTCRPGCAPRCWRGGRSTT